LIQGDVLDSQILATEIPNFDLVIHCAAIVSYAPNRFDEMYQINVEGTRNIVNECVASKVRLVHISSVAALGTSKTNQIDETALWNESEISTYYAKTKYLSELEVWRGLEEGLETIILNPSVVLGRGDLNKSSTKLFSYVLNGGKFYTEGNVNFVDVRNVVQVIVKAITMPETWGKKYILNSATVTYKTLFESIAAAYQVKAPFIKVNKLIAALAWRLEYIKYLITGKEPLITKETSASSQSQKTYLNTQSIKVFDVNYYSLTDTLNWVCQKNITKKKS
jgi:nucleoside-diphosphate-sugar epimerase